MHGSLVGGNGGSLAFIDLDARMAIGFVPNRWITGPYEQGGTASSTLGPGFGTGTILLDGLFG